MNHCTKEQLIAFESGIKKLWEGDYDPATASWLSRLPYLIHLSGGNEEPLIELFKEIQPGDWVFSGHRNHYHFLLSGGSPALLKEMICSGNSMFVYGRAGRECECQFLTSSILAGTCGIAAGVAWEIKHGGRLDPKARVWCFLGDGAEDEGHFYEAVMFVTGHQLPCTFIIEDNDRSVDTTRDQRRGQINHRGRWYAVKCVRRYEYTATYPHAGSGCKHHIQFKPK